MSEPLLWERDAPTWPNTQCSRFVQAAGMRWHVQRMGSGPTLLLVHGMGASTHSWRGLLPLLAERFDVVAADLPGHGFTDSVAGARCSLNGMSASMAALLRAMHVEPEFCVGHSAGAAILARMSLDAELRAQVLISINGALLPLAGAAGLLFSPLAKMLAAMSFMPRLLSSRALDRAAVERILASTGSKLDTRGVDLYARLVRDPKHVAGALAMMAQWDLNALATDLKHLKTPLRMVVAQNDRTIAPDQALRIQALNPAAAVLRLEGLGHLAHEEQPARIAHILLNLSHGLNAIAAV